MYKKKLTLWVTTFFIMIAILACNATPEDDGYISLLKQDKKGNYNKHGWNHYGPGYFTLDTQTGVLEGHGGMGLFWFSEKKFNNFILELDFMTSHEKANSGIFFRIPNWVTSDQYIHESFEIQIDDKSDSTHVTGSVYDAKGAVQNTSKGPNEWNHYKITLQDANITVELNGTVINTWTLTAPIGKIKSWSPEGYIGLQNHDKDTTIKFRNIRVKEL